jgi:hypothetical protein
MEKVLCLNWEIHNIEAQREERYCHNCGKKVIFTDSLKRRQNANGKNIYHYAIYKCDKGHSWNKMINTFKAVPDLSNLDEELTVKESILETIIIDDAIKSNYDIINIKINEATEKLRIDKFLSHQIKDMSRSNIEKAIKEGIILIDGKKVKNSTTVKKSNVITINVREYKVAVLNCCA